MVPVQFAVLLLNVLMTCDCFPSSNHQQQRRALYFNGLIYTVNPEDPEWHTHPHDVMVVNMDTGKIDFIGEEWYSPYDNSDYSVKYDLERATILPGFHDVHVHMHPFDAWTDNGCLVKPNTEPEHLIDTITKCDPQDNGEGWVIGQGYSLQSMLDHMLKGGRAPREILDEALPDNPVVIMEENSHSTWVNSKALSFANITEDTADPVGGIIMRNPNSTVPNGILFENAGNIIMDVAWASFNLQELKNRQYLDLLRKIKLLGISGITSICEARTYWKRFHHLAWKKACDEGLMTVRANLGLWAYPNKDDTEQIQRLKELHTADYSDKCSLRINEIKIQADGILESTTAAMLDPYLTNMHLPGLADNIGMNYFNQSRVEKYLNALQSFGDGKKFTFHIHAVGDRGVRQMLNAIENTTVNTSRHRMTHLNFVNEQDVPRFREFGVVADFQMSNNYLNNLDYIGTLIGNKLKTLNALHDIENTGATVTLSSDWGTDTNRLSPLETIHNAVWGRQSVSVKSAIEMKAFNSANAMRHEKIRFK